MPVLSRFSRVLHGALLSVVWLTACSPQSGPLTPAVTTGTEDNNAGSAIAASATEARLRTVKGRAFLDVPIVGASIVVQDLQGNEIPAPIVKTSANGAFIFAANGLNGRDLRFVVKGGTRGGVPFVGTLEVAFEKFHAWNHPVYCNAATTLASRLVGTHFDMRPGQADAAVRRYLKLPAQISLGVALTNHKQRLFSGARFVEEAAASGGHEALIDVLSREVHAQSSTGRFRASKSYQVQQAGSVVGQMVA